MRGRDNPNGGETLAGATAALAAVVLTIKDLDPGSVDPSRRAALGTEMMKSLATLRTYARSSGPRLTAVQRAS